MVVDEVVPEDAPQASVATAPAITAEAGRPALEYVLETPQPVALPPPSPVAPQASVAHYRTKWCTPCARNFPMVQSCIVYWISRNLTQSPLMYQYQYLEMK